MAATLDTGETLYMSLVKAAVCSIRECAQDLSPNHTLKVTVDTFASEHKMNVSTLQLRGGTADAASEEQLAKCEQDLLNVVPEGGTSYFDAGISSLQTLHAKVGAGDKGFMIIATDGVDTSSVCNQNPYGQGRHKLKEAAAAVAGKVHLLVLGSDDLSQDALTGLQEASQASQPALGRATAPATFSRSSSASVSRGFASVARQVSAVVTEDASDFVMVDGDGGGTPDRNPLPQPSLASSNPKRPALRVITNDKNLPPFTSIFSPIRARQQQHATGRAATR